MLPGDGLLSSTPVPSVFTGGRALPVRNEVDYELGGTALNDPSGGLQVQMWRARIIDKADIVLDAENVAASTIITGTNITEVSFTFDRNMNLAVAYVEDGTPKLYWYDTIALAMTTTNFPGIITPRLSHDDKRNLQSAISDVIFAYLKDGDLCYRQQRDRYQTEYVLAQNVDSPGLIKIGMSRQLRMQFLLRSPT